MNKLILALSLSLIGQIIAWFHMQGQFKYDWARTHWWVVLGGIPISFAFYYSTRWYYEYFNYYCFPFGLNHCIVSEIALFVFSLPTNDNSR